jgi:hypothetical protein
MSSDWAPAITMSIIALSVSAAFVLRGPVGRALAQWISGWSHNEAKWMEMNAAKQGVPGAEVEQLRAEVDDLQRQLAEVNERLDFAERILAKGRGADRIGSGT